MEMENLVVKNPRLDTSRPTPPLNHFPKTGQGNIRSFHEEGGGWGGGGEEGTALRLSVVSASLYLDPAISIFQLVSRIPYRVLPDVSNNIYKSK